MARIGEQKGKKQDDQTLQTVGWLPMRLGFRGKIYAGIISIVLLSGLLMAFSVRTVVSAALSRECKQRGVSLAVNLAARSEEAILAVDFLRMKNLIDEVVNLGPDISYAFIQDQKGQTLAHTFKGGFPIELETAHSIPDAKPHSLRLLDNGRELIYDIAAPVFVGSHRLGTARLGLSKTRIGATTRNLMLMIFLLTGISTLIAALVGAGFADRVIRMIKSLRQASEEALKGNLDVRTAPAPKKNCWEIKNCNRTSCPAFGNREIRCWYLVDKMCSEFPANGNRQSREACRKCPVRRRLLGDELHEFAESFDAMVMSLKNHIAQLQASEENLEKADKLASLGQLSAGVAHEINNPLGLILGYTQLLLKGKSKGQQRVEDLKTIEKHSRNCKRIVEALLNFARRTETKRAAVDINQTIREVLTLMRHQLELEGLRIETSLDESLPPVQGDSEKLKQVLMNLILNARQAITGPGEITLSSSYLPPEQKAMIRIHDTGSGIAPEFINKVFDPFFTTKPTGQGTGLGLSLSYGIVKEHGGELLVTSDPGKGSTFSVVLPLDVTTQLDRL